MIRGKKMFIIISKMIPLGLKEIKLPNWKCTIKWIFCHFLLSRFIKILLALEILPPPVMIVMEINIACQIWFTDTLL